LFSLFFRSESCCSELSQRESITAGILCVGHGQAAVLPRTVENPKNSAELTINQKDHGKKDT
jgi:hypothetical protein